MTTRSSRTRSSAAVLAALAGLAVPLLPVDAATAATAAASTTAPAPAPDGATARRSAPVLDLPNGLRPEGITSDGRTLFVSSLADGRILAVDPRSGRTRTLLPGAPGRALRGMQVDSRSGLLYVTGSEGTAGVVLAVDRRTGHVVRRWSIPDAGFLNDLVVTQRAVWVTDSRVDRLARIALDRHGGPAHDGVELVPLRGPWPVPDPAGNRANGIRALPDGTLLLDHSTAGGLWTVDPRSGAVRRVEVSGGPAITGGDGVELRGDRVWIVRGTGQRSVSELRLSTHHGTTTARWVRDLTDASLDVPSTAVLAGGRLWTVNARFGVADPASARYWVTGLAVRHR